MSSADLLEDGFPHSTPEGYKRGCKGSRCPGVEEFGWACTYAYQRYQRDYWYRRQVDAGKSPAEIKAAEADRDLAAGAVPKVKSAPAAEVEIPGEVEVSAEEAPQESAAKRGVRLSLDHPDFPHGQASGVGRGCKDEASCPGGADGRTCREAFREYQREWRARRKQAEVPAAVAPKPAPPRKPLSVTPVPEVDAEQAWQELAERRGRELAESSETLRQVELLAQERLARLNQMSGELETARQELAFARERVAQLVLELDVAKSMPPATVEAFKRGPLTVTIQIGA